MHEFSHKAFHHMKVIFSTLKVTEQDTYEYKLQNSDNESWACLHLQFVGNPEATWRATVGNRIVMGLDADQMTI